MLLRIVAVLVLIAGLAGCLSDSGNSPDVGTPQPVCAVSSLDADGVRIVPTTVDPIDDNIDNSTNFETTNVRTCSLPAIGWSALDADGTPHKYLGELDMHPEFNIGAVAVVGSGEPGRVYIVDIADRANPVVLSFIDQPGAHVTDVKISDDGKILYTASQSTPSAELAQATFPDLVAAAGFSVYNIEDPVNPAYLGFVEAAGTGCHMLDPVQVAPNQDAVMCISNVLLSYLIQRDLPVVVNLGAVAYTPVMDMTPAQVQALAGAPHDVTAFHEGEGFGDGASYLAVSYWDVGLRLLDITNAPLITELGHWEGQGATHYGGNVHTAMMFDADGHRYVIASPEYTQQGVVPCLWVLSADDLSDLHLVAEWCHPGLHESQGLYLTTHQWQVAPTGTDVAADDVRIYLTYNHGGVWVLDFGAILAGDDQGAILGFNLARTPIPDDHVPNAILSTWDVNVADGYIYGTDRATGLWVWHYQGDANHAGDQLGDERLRGFS